MDQWLPLAGIVVLVLVLWFAWSLTRSRSETPDLPDPDLIRPRGVEAPRRGLADAVRPAAPDPEPVPAAQETHPANPAPAMAAVEDQADDGPPDDLSLLKGVGPKLVALLGTLGVRRYAQIAAWSDADVARIDAELGTFKGRIVRDAWIEQARFLAAGDVAGFEARFGKLDRPLG